MSLDIIMAATHLLRVRNADQIVTVCDCGPRLLLGEVQAKVW